MLLLKMLLDVVANKRLHIMRTMEGRTACGSSIDIDEKQDLQASGERRRLEQVVRRREAMFLNVSLKLVNAKRDWKTQ